VKLTLLSIGRDRASPFAEAADDYAKRLRRALRFESIELPASKKKDRGVAQREEAQALQAKLSSGRLVVLEIEGELLSSAGLAERLSRWMLEARDVDLLIGGDEGLSQELIDRADERLSLGRITLPHRLARLVLTEQLYRATTILRGEPYHK